MCGRNSSVSLLHGRRGVSVIAHKAKKQGSVCLSPLESMHRHVHRIRPSAALRVAIRSRLLPKLLHLWPHFQLGCRVVQGLVYHCKQLGCRVVQGLVHQCWHSQHYRQLYQVRAPHHYRTRTYHHSGRHSHHHFHGHFHHHLHKQILCARSPPLTFQACQTC